MQSRCVTCGLVLYYLFFIHSAAETAARSLTPGPSEIEDAAVILVRPGNQQKSLSDVEEDLKLQLKLERERVAAEQKQLEEIQRQEKVEDRQDSAFRSLPLASASSAGPSLVRKEGKFRRSEALASPDALISGSSGLAAAIKATTSSSSSENDVSLAGAISVAGAVSATQSSSPPSKVALGDAVDDDGPSVEDAREGGGMGGALSNPADMRRPLHPAAKANSPQLPSLREDQTEAEAHSSKGFTGKSTGEYTAYKISHSVPTASKDAIVSAHYPVDTLEDANGKDKTSLDVPRSTPFDGNNSNSSDDESGVNDDSNSSTLPDSSSNSSNSSSSSNLDGDRKQKGHRWHGRNSSNSSNSSSTRRSPVNNSSSNNSGSNSSADGDRTQKRHRWHDHKRSNSSNSSSNNSQPLRWDPFSPTDRNHSSNSTNKTARNDTKDTTPRHHHRPKSVQVEIPLHSVSVEQTTKFVKEQAFMERDRLCPSLGHNVTFEVSAAHAGISSSLNVALKLYFPSTGSSLVVTVLWTPTPNPLAEAEEALAAAREDLFVADKWTGLVETGAKFVTPLKVCDWPPRSKASMVDSTPSAERAAATSTAFAAPPLGLLVEEELNIYRAGLRRQSSLVKSTDDALLERKQWREEVSELPASFDWRAQSPVCLDYIHDQGLCGTSYIFAAVDSLSDRVCISVTGSARPRRMSPMRPVMCEDRQAGCHGGGTSMTALKYIAKHGSVPEADWPYSTACFDSSKCSPASGPVGGCQTDISYKAKCADFFSVAQVEQIENWNDAAAAALLNCDKVERANPCKSFVRSAFKGGSLKFVANSSFCLLLTEKWKEFSVEASTTSTSKKPVHTSSTSKGAHSTTTVSTTPFTTTDGASLLDMEEFVASDQSRVGRFETGRSRNQQSWDWWWWWPWSNDTNSTTTTTTNDLTGPLGGFDLDGSTTTIVAGPVSEAYGFHIGERVLWAGSDDDVPTGSVGTITNFTLGKVVVHFPSGTWGFDAKDLTAASAADYLTRVCDIQRCSASEPKSAYSVANAVMIVNHIDVFKSELYNRGPFYTSFHVYEDFTWFFSMWPSEAYTRQWGIRLGGHAAVLIGWEAKCTYHTYVALLLEVDDRSSWHKSSRKNSSVSTPESSDGTATAECWVLRNSWGEAWGDSGHFRLKDDMLTGSDEVNIHIASVAPEPTKLNHTMASTTAAPWSIKTR